METTILTKICSICKQELTLKYFSKHTANKDGLCYHCKECEHKRREQLRERRALHIPEDGPLPKNAFKVCTCCKESKAIEDFGATKKNKSGRLAICKLCANKKHIALIYKNDPASIKHRQRQAEYRKLDPEVSRMSNRVSGLKRTGAVITLEGYKEKIKYNKGYCDICGEPNKKDKAMALDHCHTTGKVRGWLCDSCNGGLGMFKDNITNMLNAILYLKEHKEQ